MKAPAAPFITAGLVLAGAGLLLLWVRTQGGAAGAGQALGAAAVDAAGGAVSGAVGAVSGAVGLPSPSQTTTDPAVARWIIDQYGYLTASTWAGVPALVRAATMDAGTGTAPPAGTAAHAALVKPAATRDRESIDAGIDWRLYGL